MRISRGSEPATSGSVIEKALRISPASSGASQRRRNSALAPMARSSALPESGALLPKIIGANSQRPRISCMRAKRTCPQPWPPRSGPRWQAQSPCRRTCSFRGSVSTRHCSGVQSPAIASSGRISASRNSRIQSSFGWKSSSVAKSQAMFSSGRLGAVRLGGRRPVLRTVSLVVPAQAGTHAPAARPRLRWTPGTPLDASASGPWRGSDAPSAPLSAR